MDVPLSVARGPWLPLHGPRQDGAVTTGPISCSEMESVLSVKEPTKLPCTFQLALFDTSGRPTYRFRTTLFLRQNFNSLNIFIGTALYYAALDQTIYEDPT